MNMISKCCLPISAIGLSALLFGSISPIAQMIIGKGIGILSVICLVIAGLDWVIERGVIDGNRHSNFLRTASAGVILALVCSAIASFGNYYGTLWMRSSIWECLIAFFRRNWVGIVLATAGFVCGSFAITEILREEFKDCGSESDETLADEPGMRME